MEQRSERAFVFTASGREYFKIWIVNLLLSIVTIGFYSPWAKVRRLRYFYGNTLFDGSPFEFHGDPIALLKGRLIGVVLLIAYTQTAKLSVTLWLAVVLALVALFPWLLWKSLRFRLSNSSYRGIRFGFDGSVAGAYGVFVPMILMVLGPAVALLVAQEFMVGGRTSGRAFIPYFIAIGVAFGLAPWFYFRLKAYQHSNARLGSAMFSFGGRVRSAYAIAGKTFVIGILFLFIAMLGGFAVGVPVYLVGQQAGATGAKALGMFLGIGVGYLLLFGVYSCLKAMIQNFVWTNTTLAGVRFQSNVSRTRLWRIEFVNLLLTIVTLGFFWPFAVVRSMRYRVQSLAWSGDSDALTAPPQGAAVGAIGEESADLFGLELAL